MFPIQNSVDIIALVIAAGVALALIFIAFKAT